MMSWLDIWPRRAVQGFPWIAANKSPVARRAGTSGSDAPRDGALRTGALCRGLRQGEPLRGFEAAQGLAAPEELHGGAQGR